MLSKSCPFATPSPTLGGSFELLEGGILLSFLFIASTDKAWGSVGR